jgi:hypothetical protein
VSYGSRRRAGSSRRSDLPDVMPHFSHELRETLGTVGVHEREIGQLHAAMGLSIRPLRDPVLTIRGKSGLVSNVSADATDGERASGRSTFLSTERRPLTSGLRDQLLTRHPPPPSFTCQTRNGNGARHRAL